MTENNSTSLQTSDMDTNYDSNVNTSDINRLFNMLRNWAQTGFPQDQAEMEEATRLDEACKSSLSTLTQPAEVRKLPFAAARLHKSLHGVLPILSKFSGAIVQQLEIAEKRVRVVTLLFGIASLPDDLLAYVFDFVVGCSGRKDRSPLVLSHVSLRFRRVALGTSSLWSSIRAASNSDTLTMTRNTTYLERSGMSPLDITFILHPDKKAHTNLVRFMGVVLPHAARWRQFNLELNGEKVSVLQLFDSLKEIGNIHLPQLERLRVFTNFHLNSWFDNKLEPFLNWTAPGLRALELRDFAVDVLRFSSLTDVSVSIHSVNFPFSWFFKSLESLPSLRSLHVGLHSVTSSTDPRGVILPSVLHVSFAILVERSTAHDQLLSTLSCPNIIDLSIAFSVTSELSFSLVSVVTMQRHFARLFANCDNRYQHLFRLRLEVTGNSQHAFEYAINEIPLASLPSLKHLLLEGLLAGPPSSLKLQDTDTFPALETITVQSPRPDKLFDWLSRVTAKLEAVGVWKHFDELRVVVCKHDEERNVVKRMVIPRDQVHERLTIGS